MKSFDRIEVLFRPAPAWVQDFILSVTASEGWRAPPTVISTGYDLPATFADANWGENRIKLYGLLDDAELDTAIDGTSWRHILLHEMAHLSIRGGHDLAFNVSVANFEHLYTPGKLHDRWGYAGCLKIARIPPRTPWTLLACPRAVAANGRGEH